jgi:hypothetical protein
MCESVRKARDQALAAYEAQGGKRRDFNNSSRQFVNYFHAVPGLHTEIMLLAWKCRHHSPLMSASTLESDVDGSRVRVRMMPRSFWDEDPRFIKEFSNDYREGLQKLFGDASFHRDKQYQCAFIKSGKSIIQTQNFRGSIIRGAEIVEALTVATRAEDLADAFAWIEESLDSIVDANNMLQMLSSRATVLHGSTTPPGLIPTASLAINNEVAFTIMDTLDLEFDIRLTGLRGTIHLNGRKGAIQGPDPANAERWKARLDDGKYVSVKAVNVVRIRHGEYKRISP